jgi:hypothetical protein
VEGLPELARRSVAEKSRVAAELARRRGEPAAVGDLFVLPATGGLPVEWLVVERDSRRPGRLFVVLADTNSHLARADLSVPAGDGSGPLSLRCRYGAWCREGALNPALRTGSVAPDLAARALRRYRELASGALALPHGGGVELSDAEYEDWIDEIVAPAYAALMEAQGEPPAATARVLASAEKGARFPPPAGSHFYPMAASVLLLVAMGLSVAALWQQRELSRLTRAIERLGGALDREQSSARAAGAQVERFRRELEQAAAAAAAAHRADQERIASRERAPTGGGVSGEPLANVPFLWLRPQEALRGEPAVTPRPAHSPYLLLILDLGDADPSPEYRLEVSRPNEPAPLWKVGGLKRTGSTELTVALPSRLLKAGEYRLRLYARGGTAPVCEYAIAVRRGSPH